MKKIVTRIGLAVLGLLAAVQLIPYGRAHSNPPVRKEPAWDSAQTRALAQRACFDCHSNQAAWPWYSHVAPISWLLQYDVDKGRSEVNFSEWDRPQREANESAETIQKHEMPPTLYALVHPHARLSEAERAALIRGMNLTIMPAAQASRHD